MYFMNSPLWKLWGDWLTQVHVKKIHKTKVVGVYFLSLLLFHLSCLYLVFFVMRPQLDIVIDNVASTVLILEAVQSSMNKMNADELDAFQLDKNLGGTSAVLQRKSVERFVFIQDIYCSWLKSFSAWTLRQKVTQPAKKPLHNQNVCFCEIRLNL